MEPVAVPTHVLQVIVGCAFFERLSEAMENWKVPELSAGSPKVRQALHTNGCAVDLLPAHLLPVASRRPTCTEPRTDLGKLRLAPRANLCDLAGTCATRLQGLKTRNSTVCEAFEIRRAN